MLSSCCVQFSHARAARHCSGLMARYIRDFCATSTKMLEVKLMSTIIYQVRRQSVGNVRHVGKSSRSRAARSSSPQTTDPVTTSRIIALFCYGVKGVAALRIARDMNINPKAAFVLLHKLREAMGAVVTRWR